MHDCPHIIKDIFQIIPGTMLKDTEHQMSLIMDIWSVLSEYVCNRSKHVFDHCINLLRPNDSFYTGIILCMRPADERW